MAKLKIILLTATLIVTTHVVFSQPIVPKDRPIKFQNNYLNFEPPGLFEFLKWRWHALIDGHPKSAQAPTPRVDADLAFIHANSQAGSQIQQAKLVFDDVLSKTIHGITPVRFRAWLIKVRTSIKPGNPTLWQDPTVRSSRNYYR